MSAVECVRDREVTIVPVTHVIRGGDVVVIVTGRATAAHAVSFGLAAAGFFRWE